jgi:hypothetical protein
VKRFLEVLILAAVATATPFIPGRSLANDGAAEVAVGGIQLRSEPRVAMRKERLLVSLDRVKVDYEFVNESTDDVVTEVAFPIPEYAFSHGERWGATFSDFKVTVGGREVPVVKEVRAFVGEREVTREVLAAGLDIESMGRVYEAVPRVEPDGSWSEARSLEQIPRLPKAEQEALRARGLLGDGEHRDPEKAAWSVRILYHWVQHFPPGQTVKISHTYSPAVGGKNHLATYLFDEACVEPPLRNRLAPPPGLVNGSSYGTTDWVSYVLTTANTWKTPIRDFELNIELRDGDFVSLCWDAPVTRSGPRTFRSRIKDFVPRKELKVFFFRAVDWKTLK